MDFISNALISLVCAIILYLYGGYINKSNQRYAPVVGTVFSLLINLHRVYDYLTEISHKHKTYRFLDLSRSHVFTSDPSNIDYILKTNFNNYVKGWVNHDVFKDLLGDGIFGVDGEKWQIQRQSIGYELSSRMAKEFSYEVYMSKAVKLAQVVSESALSNQPIEIQDLFMKSALDSKVKLITGNDVDSLSYTRENKEGTNFTEAFHEAFEITTSRFFNPFWKIMRFLNIGSEARLRECIPVVNRYVNKLIDSKVEQEIRTSQDGIQMMRRDLLSRFWEINETDPKFLRDIILNFIISGKDTVTCTLSWFIYLMCKHPLIQDRIAKEVIKATNCEQDSPSFLDIASLINEEALGKMQYLHAALTETLRLYPGLAVSARLCLLDDTLPDGSSVRKGDIVLNSPYTTGRMKCVWGEDAEVFRPERWLNQDNTFQPQSPSVFTAFQVGPRICPGKEYAYRQMKVFSAVLLGAFIFKLKDEKRDIRTKTMINLYIDGGLHVRASPRSSQENLTE